MRLEEGNMSGPVTGTKAVFPLQLPGQPLLFPSSMGTNLCGGDRSSICNIKHKVCPAHCLCGSTPTGPHPPPGPYNRLLLPMTSRHEPSLLPPRLEGRLPDSWLLSSPTTRNANYESLLINGIPSSYRKFNSPDGYHSLDYALLASARRKNATRETTSTLKQWLNEHRKNPYPTKGEKVMLAILTKMTLTQVSTWFANARRRLKKENKMTWSPRKKSNERKNNPDSASLSSLSDQEAMDVDIVNAVSKLDEKSVSNRADSGIEHSNSSSPFIFDIESQRTSVIRSVESPTFDEIKSRFKSEPSPVNHLQKWVDGCFEAPHEEEDNGYGKDMTPPSTPIEQQVTTFTSQKLFEAFDAAKIKDNPTTYSRSDSYTSEPIGLIFSSKQPVCSTKEVEINTDNKSIDFPFSYNTPQPSPTDKLYTGDSITQKMPKITKSTPESTEPIASEENKDVKDTKNETKPTEYRAQGLTTSRELEAVLALTALCKT